MKRRTKQINFRISPNEKASLESAARKRGFRGVGEYVRSIALSGKTPTEYIYTIVIHPGEADEGGFWAEVPALPGCNSQGETYEQTIANTREAIEGYIRMLVKLGEPIPVQKQPAKTTVTAVKVAV